MKKISLRILCMVFILSSCSPQNPSPAAVPTGAVLPTATAIPSPTPAGPEVVVTHPELEVISPDNIDRLEQIDSWGDGKIYEYAVSPDQSMIAVSTARTVFILDSSDMTIVRAITRETFPRSIQGNPVEFSPDGQYLVYATNNAIYQVDLNTYDNRYIGQSVLDDLSVLSIHISPDNSTIALISSGSYSACDGAGGNISVYSPSRYLGSPYYTYFYCHPAMPMIRYTNTGLGYIFYDNSYDYEIPILDLRKQMVSKMISSGEISPYGNIENISPDGRSFAVSENENGQWKVQIVDARTFKTTQLLDGIMNNVSYSEKTDSWQVNPPDTPFKSCGLEVQTDDFLHIIRNDRSLSRVLVITKLKEIQIWDIVSCSIKDEFDTSIANSVKFSPDNVLMAIQSGRSIQILDMETGGLLFTYTPDSTKDHFITNVYDISPDGNYLIAGTFIPNYDNQNVISTEGWRLSVWNLHSGMLVNRVNLTDQKIASIDAGSGNGIIALTTPEGAEIWDYLEGKQLSALPSGTIINVDKESILIMDDSSVIYRFDPSRRTQEEVKVHPSEIFGVVGVNTQEQKLTGVTRIEGERARIVQYSLITGALLRTMNVKGVESVIPGNGSIFFTLDGDSSFDIWDSDNLHLINHFAGYTDLSNLKDHSLYNSEDFLYSSIWSCPVDDAVLSVNSDFVITYGSCEGLRVWDVRTNDYLGDIPLNYLLNGFLPSLRLSFSPDGRLIAVVGDDGIIRLWGVKVESAVGSD